MAGLAVLAVLAATGAVPTLAAHPGGAEAVIADAQERLLAGEPLPADLDQRLRRLDPVERLRVLVFLRRSGMLTDPGRDAGWLLAPAAGAEAAP